jgi:hypothetical protein
MEPILEVLTGNVDYWNTREFRLDLLYQFNAGHPRHFDIGYQHGHVSTHLLKQSEGIQAVNGFEDLKAFPLKDAGDTRSDSPFVIYQENRLPNSIHHGHSVLIRHLADCMMSLGAPPLNRPDEPLHRPTGFFRPNYRRIRCAVARAEQTGDVLQVLRHYLQIQVQITVLLLRRRMLFH